MTAALAALVCAALSWEQAFPAPRRSPALHVQARVIDEKGAVHRVELWRSGDRLRRRTDGGAALLATRGGDGELRFVLLDEARRLRVTVARSNLLRLGLIPEWSSLSSLLLRPPGEIQVEPARRKDLRTPHGRCRWLRAGGREVCWSGALGLALRIEQAGHATLEVDAVERRVDPALLEAPVAGWSEIDADADLDPSQND